MFTQVGAVQREFVLQLLDWATFAHHIAAVREANMLLCRAVELRPFDGGAAIRVRPGDPQVTFD